MNLNNFEKEINPVILQRGLDYFEDGHVTRLSEKKENLWSAIVEGTENYRVKVEISDNIIISSMCNCPFDMGSICKHEVAVFYEIREVILGDSKEDFVRETDEKKLKKILNKMKKGELIDIIINQALNDNKFYNLILAYYEKPGQNVSKEYYKKFLESYLEGAMDMYGFIDYYHADEAAEGAFQLIEEAATAIENNEFEKAICIAQAIIEEMVPSFEFTDDSGGDSGSAVEDAFDILLEIAGNELNKKTKEALFSYCLKESEKKIYNDYGDWQFCFIGLAVKLSSSVGEMNKIIKALENNIKSESSGEYISSYSIQKLSIMKYDLLITMGRHDEAEKFFINSLHFPDFRRIALNKAFKNMEYDRVIGLALDGEKKDRKENSYGLVREWKEWRFKVYQRKKDNPEIHKLAYEFLVNHNDIKYYDAYKKSSEIANWEGAYDKLKKGLKKKSVNPFSTVHADVLVKEKELQTLLDMLKKYPQYVSSYQEHFLKSHPEEIYKLHMANIRDEAKRADNRKRYQYLCGDIKKLKKIGGAGEAKILVQEFRETYKNRPAFQDELSKI